MSEIHQTTTTREMLASVKTIGAMPFILFEYYLTWQDEPNGIRPSLETIATDLGLFDKQGRPSKSAACNLKKILISKGWIKEENGQVIILKSFRNSEHHSEKMNDLSEFLNDTPEIQCGTEVAKLGFIEEIKCEDTRALEPISENKFIPIYNEYFPHYKLNILQQEIIENRIHDETIWREALFYWSSNDYRPQSISKICDKHDELIAEALPPKTPASPTMTMEEKQAQFAKQGYTNRPRPEIYVN